MLPGRVLRLENEARRLGREIAGYYHSHPKGPAIPSKTDQVLAWTGSSYLIVAVFRGQECGAESWRLTGDSLSFTREHIIIQP